MAAVRPITAHLNEIFSYQTYLTVAASAAAGTITVKNIASFAINQILLIGELGSEEAEIIKTHASTAPTGSTITLAANLARAHGAFTKVTVLIYDQMEFSHAATATGAKSVLATVSIPADEVEARYDDTAQSSGYYFVRYKNSISAVFSDYSDPIPYAGFDMNTVSFVIAYALNRNKLQSFTWNISYDFCIDEIRACLREISGKLKTWTKLQEFDYSLGNTLRGTFSFALPSTIWENESNKSILGVRIGGGTNLSWKTKSEWEEELEGVHRTQVRTQGSVGATSLAVDNSYDFSDTGTINVYVSGTLQAITYTGVTRDDADGGTATFTGIPASGTGSITATIPVDTNVWQGEEEGEPTKFTVFGGNLYIWPLASATYDNKNVLLDFSTAPTTVDSEADELDAFRYDAVKHWLTWAIRSQLGDGKGKRDFNDADYLQYASTVGDYIRNETAGHRKKRKPKMNNVDYGGSRFGPPR